MGSESTFFSVDTGGKRPYEVEISNHTVVMRGLPAAAEGLTFVHLSDIHIGYGNTEPVFEETIARVNEISPDYLLITGDYIDDHAYKDYPLVPFLKRFTPRLGTYVSFGNHDHRRGIESTAKMLEEAGVCILNNTSVRTEQGLWLVGVDDYFEGQPDVARAFANVPDDVTSILLSHNPKLIDYVSDRDVVQLAGHTHGGQIALPFPTPRMVVKLHLRCNYVAGWYTRGRARLYVSRGLGVTGKPFRYRCPAEIGVFRLLCDTAR